MANIDEQVHELAVAVIEDSGEDAHRWTKLRAAHFRKEGDNTRADLWDRVADMVLKLQRGLEHRLYH
jgi:hypothetical protein